MNSELHTTLSAGFRHSEELRICLSHTVPEIDRSWPGFVDMPPVLATATMIAFVEQTCAMGLRPLLSEGQRTVGTYVDISHVAATPVGMLIKAEVKLVEIDKRNLLFQVRCSDTAGLIGEGMHRRAIVELSQFMQRLDQKSQQFQ